MSSSSTPGATLIPPSARVELPPLQSRPLPIHQVEPAPCTAACPAGVNVKAYVSLIAEGRFAEALEEVRRHCTLPSVCGRICHAPCEAACVRTEHDDPLAIRALKRFVSDLGHEAPAMAAPHREERVAIVGSGPAGLTAAHDLRRAGFSVTVLEALSEPGGMLRHGVADYRLPPDVLDAEIESVLVDAIELRTDSPIRDFAEVTELLSGGYAAVLLALGAQNGRVLGIAGEEESAAVEDALGFLRRVNGGDHSPMSGKVVVVGGGSTAIEAARTALRLGANPVEVVYRRSQTEMPASGHEVEHAESEGISFRFLAAPHRIVIDDGELQGVECLRVALGSRDAEGRPRPEPIPGSEYLIEADHVLAAVGQEADLHFISGRAAASLIEHGLLHTDATRMTAEPGVFAAGDVVTGPATVIEAIAAGHDAAASIISYLEAGTPGAGAPSGEVAVELGFWDPDPVESPGIRPELTEIQSPGEFAEVEQAFTADDAVAEALRCLRCGPCAECAACVPSCDRRHLFMGLGNGAAPATWLPVRAMTDFALKLGGNGVITGRLVDSPAAEGVAVDLVPMRMRYSADLCRGCARCIEVCQFDAFTTESAAEPDAPVLFDETACRGCALCGAVCPTGALVPIAHSERWWETRHAAGDAPTRMTLRCDTQVHPNESEDGATITCRCVGQLHPGMLLELFHRGADEVAVVPCASCRFKNGPDLTAVHVAESQRLLEALGRDGGSMLLATEEKA